MSEYQPANLENLFVKRAGKRMRVASCDPTGGNNDNVLIPSGETYLFADLQGPGIVTHFFCTIGNPNKRRPECGIGTEEFNVRKVVLNVYWDDETEPSIQAPLGDFFGMGHGITKSFASAPLQITPEDGRGFNCWFPMPFRRRARFTVKNECCSPLHDKRFVDTYQLLDPWINQQIVSNRYLYRIHPLINQQDGKEARIQYNIPMIGDIRISFAFIR